MARYEATARPARSEESAAQMRRVADLVRDACSQFDQLLMATNSRLSPEERRRYEEALRELRYAIQYLNLQDPGGGT